MLVRQNKKNPDAFYYNGDHEETKIWDDSGGCWIDARSSETGCVILSPQMHRSTVPRRRAPSAIPSQNGERYLVAWRIV